MTDSRCGDDQPRSDDQPPSDDSFPSDASAPDFHIAPRHDEPAAEWHPSLISPRPHSGDPSADPPSQFSLGELSVWMAIVSVGLSGLTWLRPPIYAGLCGFLALAVMIVMGIGKSDSPVIRILWYALLVMYVIAIVIVIAAPSHLAH